MYSYDAIARYTELGCSMTARPSTIANYFQDCAILQSEEVGIGIKYLNEKQRAWFLLSWQIVVDRYPVLMEKLKVRTWAYDFKGFLGYRNIDILDEAGNRIVYGASIWSYMDTAVMKPVRIEPEVSAAYPMEPAIDMEYAPRKIALAGEGVLLDERRVMAYQIDSNGHMNNEAYIAMAEEYADNLKDIKEIRAEYKKQLMKNDVVKVRQVSSDGRVQIIFTDEDDDISCVVMFIYI